MCSRRAPETRERPRRHARLSGRVLRIATDGARSVAVDGPIRPTSVLVDSDGTVYVTNRGVSIGAGEVLRIEAR